LFRIGSIQSSTDLGFESGARHACAVANGRVSCWGENEMGQLGDGQRVSRAEPRVVAGVTEASLVSMASNTTCAVAQNDSVYCWGRGQFGLLGNGARQNSNTPVRVVFP
jgi:alpha-tubulin suppressor-like RCC1 family protein